MPTSILDCSIEIWESANFSCNLTSFSIRQHPIFSHRSTISFRKLNAVVLQNHLPLDSIAFSRFNVQLYQQVVKTLSVATSNSAVNMATGPGCVKGTCPITCIDSYTKEVAWRHDGCQIWCYWLTHRQRHACGQAWLYWHFREIEVTITLHRRIVQRFVMMIMMRKGSQANDFRTTNLNAKMNFNYINDSTWQQGFFVPQPLDSPYITMVKF